MKIDLFQKRDIIESRKEGVTEEWLRSKAKTARKYSTFFYRNADELDLSGFPKSSRDNIQVALEKQVLIISLGAKLKIGKYGAIPTLKSIDIFKGD